MINSLDSLLKGQWYIAEFSQVWYLIQFQEVSNGIISCYHSVVTRSEDSKIRLSFDVSEFKWCRIANESEILEYFPNEFVPLRMYNELISKMDEMRSEFDKQIDNIRERLYRVDHESDY